MMLTKETARWIRIIKHFLLFGTNTKVLYDNTALVKALINYNPQFIVTQSNFHLVNIKIMLVNKIRAFPGKAGKNLEMKVWHQWNSFFANAPDIDG